MRMYFDPMDAEAYEAAKDLLTRRWAAWADDRGNLVDPFAVAAALDFRHDSVDGRLGYWTVGLVEEFLLSYAPRTLSITAQDAAGLPDTLRLLLRYLDVTGLADPTGDPPADLEAAITKTGAQFPAAMADERNFGMAKFWVMTAAGHGVDPADGPAMDRFLDKVRAGRIDYDHEVLAHIAARHAREDDGSRERAVPQLPVSLPAETELAALAEHTPVVVRLRALVSWVGDGRALTTTGNIKLGDARELVTLLDTGDTVDPMIGDRVYRTKSSAELPGLALVVELAKKIRLVRVVKTRMVRVAKAAPLRRDGLALWTAAFDALPTLDLLRRPWAAEHTRMLEAILEDVVPDVLNTVYGLPEPIPVIRLAESVWLACTEMFDLDGLDPGATTRWREGVGADLRALLGVLAEFGAVESTVGRPDPMFRADLGSELEPDFEPDDPALLPSDARDRLLAALAPDADPVELVSLTPLATRAVRARLLREGRYAPLVGELSEAEPAPLLGMIAEHYSPETAAAEIAGWLAAHGGQELGLRRLVDGIRGCPFRTRAAAMLDVLAQTVPDRSTFLRGLRADQQLGPVVTQMLIDDGELTLEELDPTEGLRAMTEQFIDLLEIGGSDAVTDALVQFPADQAREMMTALLASGHPDRTGMAELRGLAETQFSAHRPGRPAVHPLAGVSRLQRPRGRRTKRR